MSIPQALDPSGAFRPLLVNAAGELITTGGGGGGGTVDAQNLGWDGSAWVPVAVSAAGLWQVNVAGTVSVLGTVAVQGGRDTSQNTLAGASTQVGTASQLYGFDSANWRRLRTDGAGNLLVLNMGPSGGGDVNTLDAPLSEFEQGQAVRADVRLRDPSTGDAVRLEAQDLGGTSTRPAGSGPAVLAVLAAAGGGGNAIPIQSSGPGAARTWPFGDANTAASTIAGAASAVRAGAMGYGWDDGAATWRRVAVDSDGRLEVVGGGGGDVAALDAAMPETVDGQAVRADLRLANPSTGAAERLPWVAADAFQIGSGGPSLPAAALLHGWDGDNGQWTRVPTDDVGRPVVRTLVPQSADRNTGSDTIAGAGGQLGAASQNYGFDGTNWRRVRVDTIGHARVTAGGPTSRDTSSNLIGGTISQIGTASQGYGWNGSAWQRLVADGAGKQEVWRGLAASSQTASPTTAVFGAFTEIAVAAANARILGIEGWADITPNSRLWLMLFNANSPVSNGAAPHLVFPLIVYARGHGGDADQGWVSVSLDQLAAVGSRVALGWRAAWSTTYPTLTLLGTAAGGVQILQVPP